MNLDEDVDFVTSKKSAAKQGRRASRTLLTEEAVELEDNDNSETTSSSGPFKMRKTAVWSEDVPKSSKGKPGTNIIELERFQGDNRDNCKEEDDIPVIPDIDDLQDDPLNLPDAKPVVSVDKSTYKEIDTQFGKFQTEQVSFGNIGDIDLSFLTSQLFPEKEVQVPNEAWTVDSLYNDLYHSSHHE
ncbi:unnamed protein product [Acanthoscelides obtectus]|uniref:Intraflagellar transport protein 43 homolog n=1 Tax=Acanthoscelides obtectus TaxID=200917 RepID=A0A9P0PTB7_ACAOB|nr:unnamed protein product [Acanthoscelides obtectus]CAK1620690.1 Intraflagellar transport protein 43 homolog B [Acanthoscelides obtectus]